MEQAGKNSENLYVAPNLRFYYNKKEMNCNKRNLKMKKIP